ncbi:hypothetical protein Zmor_010992 [Zophobas morio]|uniref:Uncharacterized protein n=1 Tax=Zophobas morio TaxID=2755281 RepID=A0AA38IQ51_9CUCU|nr:hypothetical protein Zmor_010992 [Zophobas morio]
MSSAAEVGAEGAGELPNAPRQEETPLKSNLVVVQTWGDFAVICGPTARVNCLLLKRFLGLYRAGLGCEQNSVRFGSERMRTWRFTNTRGWWASSEKNISP